MSKRTCEETKKLPIAFLKKEGYLGDYFRSGHVFWNSNGEPRGDVSLAVDEDTCFLRTRYTSTDWEGNSESLDYKIHLVTTPCFFGGHRYWFICPLVKNGASCKRRVGILYLVGKYFGCRHCHELAYNSQQETHTGYFGLLGKVFDLESDIDEGYQKIRYKYWKGQPTRKFQNILNKETRCTRLARLLPSPPNKFLN
ncbi:hypothetical protein ACFLZY_00750 [Patescibacteria group bacterium]